MYIDEDSPTTQLSVPAGLQPPLGTGGFTTTGYIHAFVDSTSNSNSNSNPNSNWKMNSNSNPNSNSNSDSRIPLVQISDDSHLTHDSFKPYVDYHDGSHLRNRNLNGAGRVDDTDVMDRFTQWSNYKRSSSPPNTSAKPSRHTSQRRTDFTSKDELSRFNNNHNFIFHRGFLKRQRSIRREDRQIKVRSKFRNKKELASVLDYIELEQMNVADVLPLQSINAGYTVRNITSRKPAVTPDLLTRNPISAISNRPLRSRNHSIRRKLPRSHPIPRPTTTTTTTTTTQNPTPPATSFYKYGVRRSNTSPSVLYRPRTKTRTRTRTRGKLAPGPDTRQQQLLQELWKEYLMLVITQRTQLRLAFLSSPGSTSYQSSPRSSDASDLDISLLSTPPSLFRMTGHSKDDPIIIPDGQSDTVHRDSVCLLSVQDTF